MKNQNQLYVIDFHIRSTLRLCPYQVTAMHPVQRIYARVTLEPAASREAFLEMMQGYDGYDELAAALRSPDKLRLDVTLSAEDDTGRRIEAAGSFRIGGLRTGGGQDFRALWLRHHDPPLPDDVDEKIAYIERTYHVSPLDIEDKINVKLGREPKFHRPHRPVWRSLITALEQVDISISEEELIGLPLTVELDDGLRAELE